MIYRIVVPLSAVPDGGIVTKLAGQKKYTVQRQLRVYYSEANRERLLIDCEDGCVFLLPDNGDPTVYPATKEFIWHIEEDDLRQLIDPEEET